jgi:hypothetical protein
VVAIRSLSNDVEMWALFVKLAAGGNTNQFRDKYRICDKDGFQIYLKRNIAIILKAFIHKSYTWGQMELEDLLSDSGKIIAVPDYRYLPENQISLNL